MMGKPGSELAWWIHKLMALYGSAGLQDAHSLSVTYLEHLPDRRSRSRVWVDALSIHLVTGSRNWSLGHWWAILPPMMDDPLDHSSYIWVWKSEAEIIKMAALGTNTPNIYLVVGAVFRGWACKRPSNA